MVLKNMKSSEMGSISNIIIVTDIIFEEQSPRKQCVSSQTKGWINPI